MADDAPVRPRHWPREWVKDEGFWRDVASRTVAGLIVTLVAFIVGVVTGLIPAGYLVTIGIVLLTGALYVWFAWWFGPFMNRIARRGGGVARYWTVTVLQAIVVLGFGVFYFLAVHAVLESWRVIA